MTRILVADDDSAIRQMLKELLADEGYDVVVAATGREALSRMAKHEPDVMLLDVRMPDMDGLELLRRMQADGDSTPVLVMTAHGTASVAIEAIQLGAYDYLTKPLDLEDVLISLRRMLEHRQLATRVKALQEQIGEHSIQESIVGQSPQMQDVYKLIGRVAASDATVLIIGETGTGKELVADTLHAHSLRRDGPLVKVNCAALPETLLESELFGHEKGSFTGATARRPGRFELADGGTIFLDEIGEMSPGTQKKLLRVLQEGEFQRVGGTVTLKADVRVIAASNKNLVEEVRRGNFREDLYYRINVIEVRLPPLRERQEDIPLLVGHFLEEYRFAPGYPPAKISDEALASLMNHDWPGNVRELKNVIERAVIMSSGGVITTQTLHVEGEARNGRHFDVAHLVRERVPLPEAVGRFEQALLREAVLQAGGDEAEAAKWLGVDRRVLAERLKGNGRSPAKTEADHGG